MPDAPRILIVDDDPQIVRGLTLRLQKSGFAVTAANNGQLGYESTKRSLPDAIVLDIRMPVMNGLELLQKLHENGATKGVPVIILSASIVEKKTAFDLGARYFLEKPFEAKALIGALKSVLNTPSSATVATADEASQRESRHYLGSPT